MNRMKQTTEDRLLDRRLTSAIKGNHSRLTAIQVPTHDWFYSARSNELFRVTEGVFECYPRKKDGSFFPHHTLKVLEPDAVMVKVEPVDPDQPSEGYAISEELPQENFWRDVTDPQEIEDLLRRRNKRHLQQVDREGGPGTQAPFPSLFEDYGANPLVDELLDTGRFDTPHEIGPVLADWFKCIKRENHPDSKPVVGCMTKKQYQDCFKIANEKVSSGDSVHYTLWKAMAAQDDMAEFLCILISLPFDQWLHEIDVMLEKKKGNFKIHMLRIIGLLEADFNTALKFFFSREMMENTERDGMTDEQWGGRRNRSSVDAAMLKLLTFECARIKKATIADTMYDLVACFDRVKAQMSNIIAQQSLVDKNIIRARAIVIENLRRSVKTGLGVSKETYGQEPGEPAVDGEVQDRIIGMVKRMVQSIINHQDIDTNDVDFPTELLPVFQAQSKIGITKLLRGFLAKEWMPAMELYGEKHPERRMVTLLKGLWDVLFEPIWTARNHILHDLPNRYNDAHDARNWERLARYRQHRHKVLAFDDRDLADISIEKLQAMTAKTRRKWVSRLDRLRTVYEKELETISTGQQVLNQYFDIPRSPPRATRQKSTCQRTRRTQTNLFDGLDISVRKRKSKSRRQPVTRS
ncbi:hypothetical protein ACHAXN_007669, partial [Cyclotella atomus]